MNAFAILVVNDHLEQLRREAAERHARPAQSPAFIRRIAAATADLKAALVTPASITSPIVPTLNGYPYRG
jgi:hypothetical protein